MTKIHQTLHTNEPCMIAQEVLEIVAREMVAAGLYTDVPVAIRAIAQEQSERKIGTYRMQVEWFEKNYNHNL